MFLFKARILICKVRRISEDRSVFILKEIIRLPETEVKDCEGNNLEIISKSDGNVTLVAHKEETKRYWLSEIKEYITDVVALQEHSIDDLRIDPKQHIDTSELLFKLPHRIEAYESDQNIKPSDVAGDYTVYKYSATKADQEIKTGVVSSIKESQIQTVSVTQTESVIQEVSTETKQKPSAPKEISKIPKLVKKEEKSSEKLTESKPVETKPSVEKLEQEVKVEKTQEIKKEEIKVEQKREIIQEKKEEIKVEQKKQETYQEQKQEIKFESSQVEQKQEVKVEVKQETKSVQQISEKQKTNLQTKVIQIENTNAEDQLIKSIKDSVDNQLTSVEASVTEKLDQLSQKLREIRKTEVDKEITRIVEPIEVIRNKEEDPKQKEIREKIQEEIDDYISESSVIKRIEEKYKSKYKDRDIKNLKEEEIKVRKASLSKLQEEDIQDLQAKKKDTVSEKAEIVSEETLTKELKETQKSSKELQKETPVENKKKSANKTEKPQATSLAGTKSGEGAEDKQQDKQESTQNNNNNSSDQSASNQGNQQGNNSEQNSGGSRRGSQSGGSRRGSSGGSSEDGSIRFPEFNPPPPQKYEASIEVYVKKDRPPAPPPKITRKIVLKNEELERKTEEFLRGEIEFEKEDFTFASAQKKIKNLKHNIGRTEEQIQFAEDTVNKAKLGDFKHIKTPGTVVPERKKDPLYEYQYTVEDPATGLCITSSEPVDIEEAEEELKKLAEMESEIATKTVTKKIEGKCQRNLHFYQKSKFYKIFRKLKDYLISLLRSFG